MSGIDSYSTTPATNATIDGGTTFAEGQSPSTINNGIRQVLADVRSLINDFPWFQYGTGDQDSATHLAVPAVYASATSFTITGADVTLVFSVGRRVRAVGALTGTIYGTITATSYDSGSSTTTITVTWDGAGALTNETLVISVSLIPGVSASFYDQAIYIQNTLADSEIIWAYEAPRALRLPAALTASRFTAAIAATAATVLTLFKNGGSIGTLTWAIGGTVPTVSFAAKADFAIGDVLTIVGPATHDATLAFLRMSLVYTVL